MVVTQGVNSNADIIDMVSPRAAGMSLFPVVKYIYTSAVFALISILLNYNFYKDSPTLIKKTTATVLHHDSVSCSNQGDSEAFIKRRHLSCCSNAVCYFLQTSII